MSLAKIVLGGEIEVATPGDVKRAVDEGLTPFSKPRALPIRRRIASVSDPAVAGVGTKCLVDGAGPASGRMWDLRNLCVVGSDDHTVVAGASGALYVGQVGQVGLVDVVGTFGAVPFTATYSATTITMSSNDMLYIVVYGLAAGAQYLVTGRIDDWPTDALVAGRI